MSACLSYVESMGLTMGLTMSIYRDVPKTTTLEKKGQAIANDLFNFEQLNGCEM